MRSTREQRLATATSENFPTRHWCEIRLGGSIFMVSGWPGKGHETLLSLCTISTT